MLYRPMALVYFYFFPTSKIIVTFLEMFYCRFMCIIKNITSTKILQCCYLFFYKLYIPYLNIMYIHFLHMGKRYKNKNYNNKITNTVIFMLFLKDYLRTMT